MHRHSLIGATIAAALAAVLYAQTLVHPFFYDDVFYVVKNPAVRELDAFPRVFTQPFSSVAPGLYRPITTLSYALDYAVAGLQPGWFHFSNVVLHALTSGAFFLLALRLLRSCLGALAAALLFAAHPVHTEAVAWIAGRSEILAALFVFLSSIVFLQAVKREGGRRMLLLATSALLWFSALLSKEIALPLPLALLVLPGLSSKGNSVRLFSLFVVVFALYLLLHVGALGNLSVPLELTRTAGLAFIERMALMAPIVAHYLTIMIVPVGLRLEYDWVSFSLWTTVASAFLIFGVLAGGVWFVVRGWKAAAFGILWFFLFLLPVSNIIPIGEIVAERFLYLPSAGFFLLVGVLFQQMSCRVAPAVSLDTPSLSTKGWALGMTCRGISRHLFLSILCILFIFSILTIRRNAEWREPEILWRSTLERSPDAPHAAENLAALLLAKGNLTEGGELIEGMVQRFPEKPMANYLAAQLYLRKGEQEKAVPFLERALEASGPRSIEFTDAQRGAVLLELGRWGEALEYFERALQSNPYDPALLNNLGIAQAKMGGVEEARRSFMRAIQLFEEQRSLSGEERRNYEGAQENLGKLRVVAQ